MAYTTLALFCPTHSIMSPELYQAEVLKRLGILLRYRGRIIIFLKINSISYPYSIFVVDDRHLCL